MWECVTENMRMSEYFDSCEHIVRHCQTWIMECQLSDLETEPGWYNILGTWGLGTTQSVVGSTHWVRSAVLHRYCIKEWLLFFNSIKCENEAAKVGRQICMKVQIWIVKMKSRLGWEESVWAAGSSGSSGASSAQSPPWRLTSWTSLP